MGEPKPKDQSEQELEAIRVCADCGAVSPRTHTSYTLISSLHGWRLTRRVEGGRSYLDWRCPRCWAKYRAGQR